MEFTTLEALNGWEVARVSNGDLQSDETPADHYALRTPDGCSSGIFFDNTGVIDGILVLTIDGRRSAAFRDVATARDGTPDVWKYNEDSAMPRRIFAVLRYVE